MRYLSLFSGIEAASVAWHPLGWEAVAFAEIDYFPSAVLAHRFPGVPNLGDVTAVDWSQYAGVDVLVGGSPCQSFSVAGLRKGLADPRGNLALEYLRAVDGVRPRYVVWENVPGVLSADGGRAFGTFLGGLEELGYGFAYRVLDAQYVRVQSHPRAVPQRRRRVFVVGCLGDWRRAAAVLLERESLRGYPAPRREAGAGVAGTLEARASTGGYDPGAHGAASGHLVAEPTALQSVNCPRERKQNGIGVSDEGAMYSLTARDLHGVMVQGAVGVTLRGREGGGTIEVGGPVAHALRASNGEGGGSAPLVAGISGDATTRSGDVRDATRRPGLGIITDGSAYSLTSQGNPHAVVCMAQGSANAEISTDGGSPTLTCVHDGPPIVMAPAFSKRPGQQIATKDDGSSFALTSGEPRRLAAPGYSVRRLTPLECERLQDFPDGWTDVPYRGKQAADGPRYKAIGNSMAVNVMAWIGERIQAVEGEE